MVAPVRETVSQTLAALLTHMPTRAVLHVHAALLQMVELPPSSTPLKTSTTATTNGRSQDKDSATTNGTKANGHEFAWQVRHGGLVGMKYEVAVRPDLFDDPEVGGQILREVVEAALSGYVSNPRSCADSVITSTSLRLGDSIDDVRSVAAACLAPIANHLVERMTADVGRVLGVLWDCLGDMKDDLSSSVGFVMELLGSFLGLT